MLTINFNPFPNLETERLLLRRVDENDVNEIFALRSNQETMKYIPRPLVKTTEDALEHIAMIDTKIENNEGINWGITLKDNPKLIGLIGHYRIKPEHFRAEIGYMLLPEFNGKGIISEAVKEAVNYGFKVMKLHSIEAIIAPENHGSEKVLEKNGFVKEAHLKENEFFEGRFLDTVIYSILNKY
ncbi:MULTISPECIES: GNAT family N-acetyltransferase [Flavobacterium]|uniref:GNAT family N-acetyltransferase n=1 Tax=Flavobacterium gawalongense TaxID=2594432 RepID=A0A553BRV2_9FLAO|nr:GNAT family N-acetyltransferase [Flavobacterium gawalongense]TRX03098.1 GNAT family N-acetyltransferase [Flavobacterium gawalongense]TRX09760.1 GNAT family N-acetyltransferase [Flavobacterium gawalongense]TRX10986.1 GNAT family N-acetyltransferase [Flavobacterium gawalongense]TRX12051.1 GNAT family N-acetyltransferase [Flavobacterium gawalongense]TRX29897.1 GNAT family N-acetyltransferase [Flavobacterium gawalongense]